MVRACGCVCLLTFNSNRLFAERSKIRSVHGPRVFNYFVWECENGTIYTRVPFGALAASGPRVCCYLVILNLKSNKSILISKRNIRSFRFNDYWIGFCELRLCLCFGCCSFSIFQPKKQLTQGMELTRTHVPSSIQWVPWSVAQYKRNLVLEIGNQHEKWIFDEMKIDSHQAWFDLWIHL